MTNYIYRKRILNDIAYTIREAESAADLAHNGLTGHVRELVVSRLLKPMLPAGFEIGTGKITNSNGALSDETDIVIYNRSILPPILYSERDGIFPIEASYYAIEIKSKLTATEIRSSLKKGASITALIGRPSNSTLRHSSPVVLVLFAFDSDLTSNSSEMVRYSNYDQEWSTDPIFKAICVVGRGYWYHDSEKNGWIFHSATSERDEVVDLVSGLVNTLTKTSPASRISSLGHYLMKSRQASFIEGTISEKTAQELTSQP